MKECIRDIKVLGRREISSILAWRRHMAASFFKKILPIAEPPTATTTATEETIEEDEDMDKDIEEQLLQMNEQQRKEAKRFV